MASFTQDNAKRRKYVVHYENGKIKEFGHYKNDLKHGLWVTYYENGKFKTKEKYKKGVRLYLYKYNEKGLMYEITGKDGKTTEVKDCGC